MRRRTALQLLAGTAASVALPPLAGADKTADAQWKTAIGLNGFASSSKKYGKTFPIWEVLDYAARAGFDGVELVRGWPAGDYPSPAETRRIEALKRLYDAYGLQIFSKHLAAGDGHIDVAASFKTLRDGGFRGWIMIDTWQIPDPYDASTRGLAAIRRHGR